MGILKYGIDLNDSFANTFDPEQTSNACGYQILSNIYQSVLAPSNTAVLPGIAKSWQTTPTSVTFHLRPGAEFSNGDPVTATAVSDSLEYIKKSPYRFTLSYISSIDVENPETLVLNLSKPVAGDVLWALSFLDGSVMDPTTIPTGSAASPASTAPVGAGPFVLANYQQDSSILLKANPKYWDKGAYPLGGVDFVQVSPGPESVSALESGTVDMVNLEPTDYAEVKANPSLGVAVTKSYDYTTMQLRENAAPFNNPAVRAALEYGINREAINKAVYDGLGEPAYQPWPSWSAGYNKKLGDTYTYQPKKAKAMLAAAGFPKGVTFTLELPAGDSSFSRIAQIMQNELDASGFTVNLQQVTPSDLLTQVYIHGQGDAVLTSELSNGPDLANNFEGEYDGVGFAGQRLGLTNPTLQTYINQALQTVNSAVQGPIMQKAGAIAMATGTEVPVVFQPSIVGYNKSVVGGNVQAPIGQCRSNLAGIYIKKG